jgi:glycosyltransferase involved in cell wall biosynthesis
MIRVLHLINGLGRGGAESLLAQVASRMDRSRFEVEVACLKGPGPWSQRLAEAGIPVVHLGARGPGSVAKGFVRLARRLREHPPHAIQTWLYHSDLLGGLLGRWLRVPVAWGLHQSFVDPSVVRPSTWWTIRCCALLSGTLPARIVCCSEASRRAHLRVGYRRERMEVIRNGVDPEAFRPDPRARQRIRRELGISEQAIAIGVVARFDPQKDHRNFVEAMRRLDTPREEVCFVLCGDGVEPGNRILSEWIAESGRAEAFYLLGPRDDVAAIHAALDILCSPSLGEGLPNAVAEAMACGTPCVVTDVGDSAVLVGETGRIVPPRNPEALARACRELVEMPPEARRRLGVAARQRILKAFDLRITVSRYESLYEELTGRVRN